MFFPIRCKTGPVMWGDGGGEKGAQWRYDQCTRAHHSLMPQFMYGTFVRKISKSTNTNKLVYKYKYHTHDCSLSLCVQCLISDYKKEKLLIGQFHFR